MAHPQSQYSVIKATSQDNPADQDGAAAGAGGGSNNSQGTNDHHAEKASHVSAPPTTSASHNQQPQPPSQPILPPELTNQYPIQITMPKLPNDPVGLQRQITIHVPASRIQTNKLQVDTNKLQDILSRPAIQATLSLPIEKAAPALQAQINAALGLHPDFNLNPNLFASEKGFIQTDGAAGGGDSSEDEDDDDDDDLDDDADDRDDDREEEQEVFVKDEEPLNSDDDVSDNEGSSDRLYDIENVVVCQFDKITRTRNKWKFHLKDGIMNLNGKDYVFQKATGDAEW